MSHHRDKAIRHDTVFVCPVLDFHGASIITEDGKEVLITEKMVQTACNEFIEMWEEDKNIL